MTQCQICTAEFEKRRMGQKTCSPICERERKRQVQLRKDRRERLKTRSDWLREAQAVFNRYIRERDCDLPCVSCGRFHPGSYDAGHYRSTGAAPHLRFDEDNCHKQCVPCNQHKSGNSVEYRIRLIERIGTERVESLERNNEVRKWTIEDAKRIKAEYAEKLKALKSLHAPDANTLLDVGGSGVGSCGASVIGRTGRKPEGALTMINV